MKGLTLVELLIALALAIVVAAAVAAVAHDLQALAHFQPQASDLAQRARVALEALAGDIASAGAGPYRLADGARLVRWIPPVHPRRLGTAEGGAAFADRVTLLMVDDHAPQALIGDMAGPGDAVGILPESPCPPADPSCGFRPGDRAMLFDSLGFLEPFVVDTVAPGLLWIRDVPLSRAYLRQHGARVAGMVTRSYFFDRERRQLRRADTPAATMPVVDEVVGMRVTYFGTVFAPDAPRPPPAVANCLFDEAGAARLPTLAPTDGTEVELTLAMLSDGPWCGTGAWRFDADLYRVRRVRVELRLQAESVAARGGDRRWFANPGFARAGDREVRDVVLTTVVTPRNLGA
jgi:type II secretory pathway pseudopilin PulG